MISVQNLSRRFGPHLAVDNLSFRLERGEVVGFLGPNGAGKTTTMRMLTGFLPPSAGTIHIDGLDVLKRSLEVRARIGYLAESVPLYREHRVEEMLVFQGRLRGFARKEARRRAGLALERVGLSERARSLIGRLSKGQRQRVGLAVALLPEPEVLVLDEPTSGLDPLQRIEVRNLIRELAQDRTVLLSSHILPEIEAVCPRVIILHRGRLAADGSQEDLIERIGGGDLVHLEVQSAEGMETQGVQAALLALAPVQRVEALPAGEELLRFELQGAAEAGAAVGRLCHERGWIVRELGRERPTLERLFARISFELEGTALDGPSVDAGGSDEPGSAATPDA